MFGCLSTKGPYGVMVGTLDSHPAVRGSIPLKYLNIFIFFLVILLRKYSLIIQKVQKSTQKLSVQFRYFKLFMYVYITYNEKKESNVLGHLLLITIIFWTVWREESSSNVGEIFDLNTYQD